MSVPFYVLTTSPITQSELYKMNKKQFDVDLTYKTYNAERDVLNLLRLHPAPSPSPTQLLPSLPPGECPSY